MLDWYFILPLAQQVFAGLAMGFGAILLLLLLSSLAGGDADAEVDLDVGGGAFTLKGILAFLTFFGLGGLIVLRSGMPVWLATLVGLGVGYAMMSTIALLLARLRGLDTDGGRRREQLVGQEGEVYLRVPASGQGAGRIQVRQGARLVEVEALTKGPTIPSGARARIVEVLGEGSVLVEAIVRVGERQRSHGYVE